MPFNFNMLTLAGDAGAGSASIWPTILMIVVMVAIFYFLLIRPQNIHRVHILISVEMLAHF